MAVYIVRQLKVMQYLYSPSYCLPLQSWQVELYMSNKITLKAQWSIATKVNFLLSSQSDDGWLEVGGALFAGSCQRKRD